MLFFIPTPVIPPLTDDLRWSFQFRERFERKDDFDFNEATSDNSGTWYTRARLSIAYKLGEDSSFNAVYQYTNSQVEPTVGAGTDTDGQDLVEAYLTRKSGGSTLTVGRQKVNKGAQRLIGALEWANSSRAWLGVRLQTKDKDFFWGELAVNPVPNYDTQLAFASMILPCGETMLAYKYNDKPALRQSVYMLDHRFVRKLGDVNLELEGAYQWGRTGGRDQDAWAVTTKATKPINDKMTVFVEANVATGGKSTNESHTFDNFYPTNHLFYGYMDRQALSNMKSFAVGATWKPRKDMSFEATYHSFSLYNDSDSWYGAGGTQNGAFIDPAGASGSSIGNEIDFVWKWTMDKSQSLEAGFGIFDGGSFVDNVLGFSADQSFWGYAQYGFKF